MAAAPEEGDYLLLAANVAFALGDMVVHHLEVGGTIGHGSFYHSRGVESPCAVAGCYDDIDKSDPRYAETERHNTWLEQLKAEDRATAELIAQKCYDEGG